MTYPSDYGDYAIEFGLTWSYLYTMVLSFNIYMDMGLCIGLNAYQTFYV